MVGDLVVPSNTPAVSWIKLGHVVPAKASVINADAGSRLDHELGNLPR